MKFAVAPRKTPLATGVGSNAGAFACVIPDSVHEPVTRYTSKGPCAWGKEGFTQTLSVAFAIWLPGVPAGKMPVRVNRIQVRSPADALSRKVVVPPKLVVGKVLEV
jgi:hypothetical protein